MLTCDQENSMTRSKQDHWTNQPKDNEYSTAQVAKITGWSNQKVANLSDRGSIVRTRKGFYTKESVDAYQKDREERKGIKPVEWIVRGI